MSDKKEPQMNPANDNPAASVPQAEQPNHHHGRKCRGCLFRTFWILLVSISILACFMIQVSVILIQPRFFTYHVSEAKLTQFNYTDDINNHLLRYNLVLNFTVRNPNKKLKIYYDVVEGVAFYKGHRFSTTDVNMPWRSYLQDTKNTVRMSAVFSGQHVVVLDLDEVSEFEQERMDGVFDIDVMLYFTIRFRLGDFIPGDRKANAECKLRVPLGNSSGTVAAVTAFRPTKCDVNY